LDEVPCVRQRIVVVTDLRVMGDVRGSPLAAILPLGIRPRTHAYLGYAYTIPRKYNSRPEVYPLAGAYTSGEKGTNGHDD
jgi:hypothetical protein